MSLGAQYTARIGNAGALTLRGDMTYRDERYTDPENLPSDRLPGYTLFNGRLGFTTADKRWTFEVWGRNLTNKLYLNARGVPVLGGILGQEYVNYGAPRTYGLRVAASF